MSIKIVGNGFVGAIAIAISVSLMLVAQAAGTPEHTLTVRVHWGEGVDEPGFWVKAVNLRRHTHFRQWVARDSDQTASLELPEGKHLIRVNTATGNPLWAQRAVAVSEDTAIELTPQRVEAAPPIPDEFLPPPSKPVEPRTLNVRLVDAEGSPVGGLKLELRVLEGACCDEVLETDADGRASTTQQAAGDPRITFRLKSDRWELAEPHRAYTNAWNQDEPLDVKVVPSFYHGVLKFVVLEAAPDRKVKQTPLETWIAASDAKPGQTAEVDIGYTHREMTRPNPDPIYPPMRRDQSVNGGRAALRSLPEYGVNFHVIKVQSPAVTLWPVEGELKFKDRRLVAEKPLPETEIAGEKVPVRTIVLAAEGGHVGSQVRIRVLVANVGPAANAKVVVQQAKAPAYGRTLTVQTDEKGVARVWLTPGTYDLQLWHPHKASTTVEVPITVHGKQQVRIVSPR